MDFNISVALCIMTHNLRVNLHSQLLVLSNVYL